ncbi:hypothetical protein FKW77_010519 [Venturia effusa]|uniref:CAP-Gly domain-containing protein n=1 Tax=Venturia effusa TaxID=50376 RepID=A0A517KXT1_9PEZI|nr:hypothetical protein FKW77_010519 [Venturia effusa]
MQTPFRSRLGARPSLREQNINTASSPNLNLTASTAIARKASLNALTGGSQPSTPGSNSMAGGDGHDIDVGDTVDVPGGMYGTVKFVGAVRGKKGNFAGVELAREFAARGKNDGDVDGVRYFQTSLPGAGIFLPIYRATRRSSLASAATFPPTPTTPKYHNFGSDHTSPPKTLPKFSQSVGPGVRPSSPLFKPKRPSLPRPESPYRNKPTLQPTTGRRPSLGQPSFSKSQIGAPRFTPTPAPKPVPTKSKTPQPQSRPYSRNNSRLGFLDESAESTPTPGPNMARSSDGSAAGSGVSSGSTFTPAGKHVSNDNNGEIKRLKSKLAERDKQLKEQAASLADMENSLQELQSLIPADGSMHTGNQSGGSMQDADTAQLRATIREKNEKIAMLTAEFDAHRADFRSTIDTLEMASTETERVYEKKVEELLGELRDFQHGSEDVESVAQQLKQLEELVQELEEGLEDARRGEAEARGEVEFLRGEVERTRAELRREKEKTVEAMKGAATNGTASPNDSRDIEQRDDEIRGLKAIIHSLSSGAVSPEVERPSLVRNPGTFPGMTDDAVTRLEREKKDLQALVERKAAREEELEREVARLRGDEQRSSVISNGFSDRTATQEKRSSDRDSKGTVVNWRGSSGRLDGPPLTPMKETDTASTRSTGSGMLWCEICETSGHDILTCIGMEKNPSHNGEIKHNGATDTESVAARLHSASISSQDPDKPRPLGVLNKKPSVASLHSLPPISGAPPNMPLPNPFDASVIAGKDGSRDPGKWCALCERDGHDSINCSFEDNFD